MLKSTHTQIKSTKETEMKNYNLFETIAIFVSLSIAGVLMIVLPQSAEIESVSNVLPPLGAALFGSGLTYLLVEVSRIKRPS